MVDIERIIDYEVGELNEEETIELFQDLVDSGMVWGLQGHYGRTATAMIDAGLIESRHWLDRKDA